MKSRKLKVIAVAIIASLTFATTAFAGIFDVVGAVVGGSNYYAQKAKQSGNNHLEKLVVKIRETGDPDAVFDSVVKEYKDGKYNVNVSETDAGKVKTMTATRSDMLVRAIWILDKNQQTITAKHESVADGTPVGNTLTKKYELPTAAVAAQQIDVQKPQNNPSPFASIPFVSSGAVISSDMKSMFEEKPLYLYKSHSVWSGSGRTTLKEFIQGGKTGCVTFDNSKAIDKPLYVLRAYKCATDPNEPMSYLNNIIADELKKINDPFNAPKLRSSVNDLIAYYRAGNLPNLAVVQTEDVFCGNVNYHINVYEGDGFAGNRYNLNKQIYTISPLSVYFMDGHQSYNLSIPLAKIESVYNTIKNVYDQNKIVMQALDKNKHKNLPKQKLTIVRYCKGLSTLCEYKVLPVYRDAYFSIKLLTFEVSIVNGKQVFDFKNSKWQDILSVTQSNCVARNK